MAAELPTTEQVFTETSRLVPLLCHGVLHLQIQEMFAKFIEYKLDKLQISDRKKFLKEFCIATIFLQNFKDFRAELEYLKNVQVVTFSKIHIVIHFHAISHPHFLMGCHHLSRAVYQSKTIIVGFLRYRYLFELLKVMLKLVCGINL